MDEEIMQTAEDMADFVDDDAFEAGWNDDGAEGTANGAGEEPSLREEAAGAGRQPEAAADTPPAGRQDRGRAMDPLMEPVRTGGRPQEESFGPGAAMRGAGEAQRAMGLNRFAMARPDVKAESIPREVWQEFRESGDLLGAYARYENVQLRQRISALEQNQRNRERSAGSRRTAGAAQLKDIFDAAWDEFDD